jgi:hypothetical protein
MVFAFSSTVPFAAGLAKEKDVRDFAEDTCGELLLLLHPARITIMINTHTGNQTF